MEKPILDPTIPYIGPIYGGKFVPGKMVKIQGIVPGNANRFNIHLQCGSKTAPRDDVAIRVSVRFLEGCISLNSLENTTWGREQRDAALPVNRGEKFKIILTGDASQYMVAINGQHCYEFPQRILCNRITHLAIDGDISVTQISYELPSEGGIGSASKVISSPSTTSVKNKIDKFQKKGSITSKTSSPQVHMAPLPDMDPAIPRRLSYEAAIYGSEAAYGYQEVSIIPMGTPPSKKASFHSGSSRVVSGVPSYRSSSPKVDSGLPAYHSDLPKNAAGGPPYPTNVPEGMPLPPSYHSGLPKVAADGPPYPTNGAKGMPLSTVTPKKINRPLGPPPAIPKSPSPPDSVSIPLTAASSDVRPVKDTECQMRCANCCGIIIGGAFILGFVLLYI